MRPQLTSPNSGTSTDTDARRWWLGPVLITALLAAFVSMAGLQSPGTAVVSVSGAVRAPRNFEVPMGTTVRECIELAGGVDGRGLKAFCPGGSSTPMLVEEHLDTGMDYESLPAVGSVLAGVATPTVSGVPIRSTRGTISS